MTSVFTDPAALAAFVAASLVLALTPGPGVLYIVARTVAHGRRAGLASLAGVACGNALNATIAACGLAALLAVSSLAFTLLKLAGAAYLVYLGVKLLLGSASRGESTAAPAAAPQHLLFRDGAVVALLNPKTALFFAAFLPQFMRGHDAALAEAIGLGLVFVAIAAGTDCLYVLLASAFAPLALKVSAIGGWGRRAAGVTLIGLGLFTAVAGQREPR